MIVEIETVGFRSEVEDYIDSYEIHTAFSHYETNGDSYRDDVKLVDVDSIEELIDEIDMNCIVQDPEGNIRRYEQAEWVVRVYDGYNE